jgi:hypothetical protein
VEILTRASSKRNYHASIWNLDFLLAVGFGRFVSTNELLTSAGSKFQPYQVFFSALSSHIRDVLVIFKGECFGLKVLCTTPNYVFGS